MITEVQPNETLDGRLQIEGVISRSGMASVYKAKDLLTGQAVAVKIPHQQFESDPASFERFQREAEIGQKLNHPNILRFLDVGKHSRPYIVMEYLEGKDPGRGDEQNRPAADLGCSSNREPGLRRTRPHVRAIRSCIATLSPRTSGSATTGRCGSHSEKRAHRSLRSPPGVPSHVFLLRLHLDVYRCVLGAKQDPNEFF